MRSIFSNIKKIVIIYGVLVLVFIFILVMLGLKEADKVVVSGIPTYSISQIEAVNSKMENRKKIELRQVQTLTESDLGKDEPFR